MSHFVRVRTQIREREHLVQALHDLHCQFQEGQNLVVRGFAGNKETADLLVNTGSNYDIGFQRKDAEYEMVADWWGVELKSPIRQQTFVQQVNRQYAYNIVLDQAREQNLIVEGEESQENGDLVIVLSERG